MALASMLPALGQPIFDDHASTRRGRSQKLPFYMNEKFWGTWVNGFLILTSLCLFIHTAAWSCIVLLSGASLWLILVQYMLFIPVWLAIHAYRLRLLTFYRDLDEFKNCVRTYRDYTDAEIRATAVKFHDAFWKTFKIWEDDWKRVVFRNRRVEYRGIYLDDSEFICVKIED